MSNTIKDIYGISDIMLQRGGYQGTDKFIAGAELEIEQLRDYSNGYMADNNISVETDGSLRNAGREFILPPETSANLLCLFNFVHNNIDVGKDAFSVRTSVHVHVNCMYASPHQVKALLLLYAIFEPLAFQFVGPVRRDNIHCMPLNSTHMPNYYNYTLENLREKWHKYTAFNLLPLNEIGTVEFRHLYGTDDQHIFKTWLTFIETLWTAAMKMEKFERKHVTDLKFLREVEASLLTPDFKKLSLDPQPFVLEDNLLDVKLSFL